MESYLFKGGVIMKNENKILLFTFSVLTAIIILGICIKLYLDKTSTSLLLQLEKAQEYVKNEEWYNAKNTISDIDKNWNNLEKTWALITNHHEIDNITISLKKTIEFINSQEKPEALAAISSLKHYISHIPKMEQISLENIF